MHRVFSENKKLTENKRYEIKMVFDRLRLEEVRSWVLSHTHSFRTAFPPRRVNNIYFDTQDFDFLTAHANGVAERAKLRFRWYGEKWIAENGQLEIKKKIANLGNKDIHGIQGTVDISRSNWREIRQFLKANSPDKFKFLLNNTAPVLINLYDREYFVSFDGLVRLTLDYKLRAFGQAFGLTPNIDRPQPLKNVVVIEMKADASFHQKIADALAEFPLYCSAFSKFLTGIENVHK